jgi:hypothetical protein
VWADTCRRCKCDLRLLRAAAGTYEDHRRNCLRLLNAGLPGPALTHARNCHSLAPSADTHRLMALCHLLTENWAEAWEGLNQVENLENPEA